MSKGSEPVYIVSGWIRSGTSMMMRALEAGGLPVAYSSERDHAAAQRWHDPHYVGNDGYYELTPDRLYARDFPLAYAGKAVKCVMRYVLLIPAGRYRIVYMRRDPREIAASAQALMGPRATEDVAHEVERITGILAQRRDVEITELAYADVLADPAGQLARLGWPIDVRRAAAVVDPAKRRYAA